jgi:hypothetical protein
MLFYCVFPVLFYFSESLLSSLSCHRFSSFLFSLLTFRSVLSSFAYFTQREV